MHDEYEIQSIALSLDVTLKRIAETPTRCP